MEVGGSVLSTMEGGIAVSALRLTADATVTGRYFGADYVVHIPAGTFPNAGQSTAVFMVPGATFQYVREGRERHGMSRPDVGLFVDRADDTRLMADVLLGIGRHVAPVPDAHFQLDRCLQMNPTGFRREILYTGGSRGTVTFQYREFMHDMARPAFSQELSYDLAAGNEIGFRGARIRIVNVSNTGLRFVVLRPLANPS